MASLPTARCGPSAASHTGGGNLENAGGWRTASALLDNNSNYFVGTSGAVQVRDYFSFDLSLIGGGQAVVGLTLQLKRFNSNAGNEATETISFFDVSTDPVTLNTNTTVNAVIFNDLGTGNNYGALTLTGSDPGNAHAGDILSVALNAQALNDINTALANYLSNPITANRYFSIGGDLTSNSGDDGLLNSSNLANDPNGTRPTLVVTTRLNEAVSAPEPMTIAMFGLGLLGVAGFRRLRARG